MSAADLAAVLVTAVSVVAVVGLTLVAVSLRDRVRQLDAVIRSLREDSASAVEEARAAIVAASGEVERVDSILDAAEAISSRVDGASKVAYLALSKPVIKTAAVATGAQRAARRLRRGD